MTNRKEWFVYKDKIQDIEDYPKIIEEARNDYGVKISHDGKRLYSILFLEIPFNLEREYFDYLLDGKQDFKKAEMVLERMELSYPNPELQNIIESFRYRLISAIQTKKLVESLLSEAKKEFNNHVITLVSIIVGIITILGTANQIFKVENFQQGLDTFFSIIISIWFIIISALVANNYFNLKK